MNVHDHLQSLGTCDDALAFVTGKTAQQAWDESERPDWLIWWHLQLYPEDAQMMFDIVLAYFLAKVKRLFPDLDPDAVDAAASDPNVGVSTLERYLKSDPKLFSGAVMLLQARNQDFSDLSILRAIDLAAIAVEGESVNNPLCAIIRQQFPNPPWSES